MLGFLSILAVVFDMTVGYIGTARITLGQMAVFTLVCYLIVGVALHLGRDGGPFSVQNEYDRDMRKNG